MTYSAMIAALANATKLIRDLARILDDALFQADNGNGYDHRSLLAVREAVFHDFCAQCVKEGLPVPPMEEKLVRGQIPTTDDKTAQAHGVRARKLSSEVREKLTGIFGKQAQTCRALALVYSTLPSLGKSFSNLTGKDVECVLNGILLDLGIEPVRPEYREWPVRSCSLSAPVKPLRILVVDDDAKEGLKTVRALAGWVDTEVSFFQFASNLERWNAKPELMAAELQATAAKIIALAPAIVLMDQGLGPVEGSDLVGEIKRTENSIVFVANTGGSDDKLREAGALENCNKGDNLRGVAQAACIAVRR